MGTTLTGTTPQDTYDSLIKVTDNGPLSGTAKYLSDGLGNDSVLALSTARVGIGTNSPATALDVSGDARFGGGATKLSVYSDSAYSGIFNGASLGSNESFYMGGSAIFITTAGTERVRITSAGNVGIGTSSPATNLDVRGANSATIRIGSTAQGGSGDEFANLEFYWGDPDAAAVKAKIYAKNVGNVGPGGGGAADLVFATQEPPYGSLTERMRILATGGLTFNGDTAAANALDDYEEGTWTIGVSFGGASVGVTYSLNTGTYTKIGRQVTVAGVVVLSSKGSSTGSVRVTGLPFTVGTGFEYSGSASLRTANITFTDSYSMEVIPASTTIAVTQTTTAGALTSLTDTNCGNNTNIAFTATYFV